MTTYRTSAGASLSRLQALSIFIATSRMSEANTLLAARAWANGNDLSGDAAGKTLRDNVRRNSDVVIVPDADEREAWAGQSVAAVWTSFTSERAQQLSELRAKGLGEMEFAIAVLGALRRWMLDAYTADAATRDIWVRANLVDLTDHINALRAAA